MRVPSSLLLFSCVWLRRFAAELELADDDVDEVLGADEGCGAPGTRVLDKAGQLESFSSCRYEHANDKRLHLASAIGSRV